MFNKIQNLVNELKSNNSSVEKVKILSKYVNDKDVVKFFQYCYDDTKLYGVSSASLKKYATNFNINYIMNFDAIIDFFELCDNLNNNTFTGNSALNKVATFIAINKDYEKLLLTFFDRNLEIGMGVTQINKALGNVIKVYEVALAATYDSKKHNKYDLNNYAIQRKLNGVRLTSFIYIDPITKNIMIESKSRNGKIYTTTDKINKELMNLYKDSSFYGTNIVLDGECCLIDENGKEDWNGIVSEIRRKDYIMENPMYITFDILTENEFYGISKSMNYSVRYSNLKKFIACHGKLNHIKYVFATPYNKDTFENLKSLYVDTDKWEGFIFRKLNVPYKSGRSTDLLKYKLFKDAEFKVEGVTTGKKYMLNKNGIMEEQETVAALLISYKGNKCQVGSGLSDEQRIEWFNNPDEIIGKYINVKYKEESKNKDGSVSLQFPVLKMVFDKKRDF